MLSPFNSLMATDTTVSCYLSDLTPFHSPLAHSSSAAFGFSHVLKHHRTVAWLLLCLQPLPLDLCVVHSPTPSESLLKTYFLIEVYADPHFIIFLKILFI